MLITSLITFAANITLDNMQVSPIVLRKGKVQKYCQFRGKKNKPIFTKKIGDCDSSKIKKPFKMKSVKSKHKTVPLFAFGVGAEHRIAAQRLSEDPYKLKNGRVIKYKARKFQSRNGTHGFILVKNINIKNFERAFRSGGEGGGISEKPAN